MIINGIEFKWKMIENRHYKNGGIYHRNLHFLTKENMLYYKKYTTNGLKRKRKGNKLFYINENGNYDLTFDMFKE